MPKVCAECNELRPSVEFRYTLNSRSYGERCESCRNTPKIKCERCHLRQTLDMYSLLPNGKHRRTCNSCFGLSKNPVSRTIRLIQKALDDADVGDNDKPLEQRVVLMIRRERKAIRWAVSLMQDRHERRQRNSTMRQMLEEWDNRDSND